MILTKEQNEIITKCLIEFIERASKSDAKSTEVAVLPEIAKILLNY